MIKAVDYGSSVIVAKQGSAAEQGDGTDVAVQNKDLRVTSTQALATNIEVGKRIPSYKVLNQADARPYHLQELLRSNGRWRIITFVGDVRDPGQAVKLKSFGEVGVVKMHGDSFSSTSLSQGQRRRLALLVSYMEDRPIYVLDEWAADQDPEFRKIFYLELLPELKARGKTVVLITHDDRYFNLGDRVIKLDYGKVVETTRHSALTGSLR